MAYEKSVSELFTNYMLAEQTSACNPSRYSHKKKNLMKFVDFVGKDTLVYRVTVEQAREFCEEMAKKHTANTYRQTVRDVVRMLQYAARRKYCVSNPLTFAMMYEVQEKMYDNDTLENMVLIDRRELDKLIKGVMFSAMELETKVEALTEV